MLQKYRASRKSDVLTCILHLVDCGSRATAYRSVWGDRQTIEHRNGGHNMWKRLTFAGAALVALTGIATAADMPVKAPLPPPPPPFSWTGFYIGGQVGWVSAHDDAS